MSIEYEWHPKAWDIFAGFTLMEWAFGVHIDLARSEQQLYLGFGPAYLTVHRCG